MWKDLERKRSFMLLAMHTQYFDADDSMARRMIIL
jgi:hypothetical protein